MILINITIQSHLKCLLLFQRGSFPCGFGFTSKQGEPYSFFPLFLMENEPRFKSTGNTGNTGPPSSHWETHRLFNIKQIKIINFNVMRVIAPRGGP